jgi:two-component system sensor histidine kinase YesM
MNNTLALLRMIFIIIVIMLILLLIFSIFYSKSFAKFVLKLRQKEAELASLKAKIRPHFLYNSLEIVRMNAISNSDSETANLVFQLARQLRASIDKSKEMVFLSQELEMIEGYFAFTDLRYDHRIIWNIECPSDLENAYVLSLMIQPIVENAIIHGIAPKGEGRIEIRVIKKETTLLLTVQDDGIGMEAEEVAKITARLGSDYSIAEAEKEDDSIGIKNVHDRLRYRFGDSFGLSLESVPAQGTRIILRMPLLVKETVYV